MTQQDHRSFLRGDGPHTLSEVRDRDARSYGCVYTENLIRIGSQRRNQAYRDATMIALLVFLLRLLVLPSKAKPQLEAENASLGAPGFHSSTQGARACPAHE